MKRIVATLLVIFGIALIFAALMGFLLLTHQDYQHTEIRNGCVVVVHEDALGRVKREENSCSR